jgi:hypothetical protein
MFIIPRAQKRKAGGGKAAAPKKIITEQTAEAMESGKYIAHLMCQEISN